MSNRLSGYSHSIFSKLIDEKNKIERLGHSVIDLSIGTPDIKPQKELMEYLSDLCLYEENYKYSLGDTIELKNAVCNWYKKRYEVDIENRNITSLLGSQEGLSHICLALINPGETVLVPDPGYPIFSVGPALAMANLETYDLLKENNYMIDFDSIDREVLQKTKIMIISYPNNPVCQTGNDNIYIRAIEMAKKYDFLILHDNAYSELVFESTRGKSILSYKGAIDVCVEFNSLSKSYSLSGARIAFALGREDVINSIKALKSHTDYGMFFPFQKLAIKALEQGYENVVFAKETYYKRGKYFIDEINKLGWTFNYPKGTMFGWVKIPQNYEDDFEFTMKMLKKANVLVVPGSSFGKNGRGFIRIAFVQNMDKIKNAVENIKNSDILR